MNMQYNLTTKSGAFAPPDLSKRWASRPAAVWQAASNARLLAFAWASAAFESPLLLAASLSSCSSWACANSSLAVGSSMGLCYLLAAEMNVRNAAECTSPRSRAVRAAENDARLVVERRDVVLTQRAAACGSARQQCSLPEFRPMLESYRPLAQFPNSVFAKTTALRGWLARDT